MSEPSLQEAQVIFIAAIVVVCTDTSLHVATVIAVLVLGSRYTDKSACMLQKGNSKRLRNSYSTMKDTTSELQLRGRLQTKNEKGWRQSIFMIILDRFCHSSVSHSSLLKVCCTTSSCQVNCRCFRRKGIFAVQSGSNSPSSRLDLRSSGNTGESHHASKDAVVLKHILKSRLALPACRGPGSSLLLAAF